MGDNLKTIEELGEEYRQSALMLKEIIDRKEAELTKAIRKRDFKTVAVINHELSIYRDMYIECKVDAENLLNYYRNS